MSNFKKSFGQIPDQNRLNAYQNLPNFKNGKFYNEIATPSLAKNQNMVKILWNFFKKRPETKPKRAIPFEINDLKNLNNHANSLVWFGHSSYFMNLQGKTFLIDPVFSGNASPIPNSLKAFPGSNYYQVEHLPFVDYLIISHDHWDHLDYETIMKLKGNIGQIICGLGVGQHFEKWGFDLSKIIEKNWHEKIDLTDKISIVCTPSRHFSGRSTKRNTSLWCSYVLSTENLKIYLGGDSGYGKQFKEIGEKYGPFDWAILECGQYNENWPYIHSFPEEIVKEVTDLKAKNFVPVHHSKFKLSQHTWYEPLQKITALSKLHQLHVFTPKIGEILDLKSPNVSESQWWKIK